MLCEFENAGEAVKYTIYELGQNEAISPDTMRQAAIETVKSFECDYVDKINLNDFQGTRIRGRKFMGPFWAPTRGVLILRGETNRFCNKYF